MITKGKQWTIFPKKADFHQILNFDSSSKLLVRISIYKRKHFISQIWRQRSLKISDILERKERN